ncbi:MAG: GAF domain-containing protein [Kouleothrix sp.]|nr:GAF domain-containing protein [Kouleothrix sp.]
MIRPKPSTTVIGDLLGRRWVGFGYATFALAVLVLAALPVANVVMRFPVALFMIALALATPATGMLLGRGRRARNRPLALALLLVDGLAALGLIAVTGGASSPLWVALMLVSTATPLLLRGRWAAGLLGGVWLADGLFLLYVPADQLVPALLTWALRAAGVGLIGLVLYRSLSIEEGVRTRAQRRESVLHDFLELSNRLRVTSKPGQVLEEVALAVQRSGEFDCVTLSQVDWRAGVATVTVAIGASGRRLKAVEGLTFTWDKLAPLLAERRRAGPNTFRAEILPFRTIKSEQHLVMPLNSQFSEIQGLLTVSAPRQRQDALDEALPLLELLANQAAAALDNNALYSTMEQRVLDATETIERGREDLALARDRAETLYRIVRTLAVSLDEREVLTQALELVSQATGAEQGGIMLVEPTSGRLVFRTTLDRRQPPSAAGPEGGQGLAGWVLANRRVAIVPDIRRDTRWQTRPGAGSSARSVLAAPLLLEDEPLGVLLLLHGETDHFRDEHGQLALAAGGQIAVALSKAQLYRYVSEQSERLGLTLQQREEEISKTLAILRSIADGVVVGDRLGRVRMINPAAEAILGVSAKSFLGRQMSELPGVPPEIQRDQPEAVQQLQIGERALRAHFAPVRSSGNEWLGGVVVYHDISREVLADRLKSEFIATASHELRTPLTSIRGYVDLLLLGTLGAVSQPQGEFLKVVKHNVARLVELIDDLLDVSKVEAGEIRLRREPIDLSEVLYEVGESLYSQFTERHISLAIDVQAGLPKVMADRQRMRQVAVNLVGNACKYTPRGGHVDVLLRNGGDQLRVDVTDTGVGIREEARRHIFTPFFRADNPLRDEVSGTGLGLSITKKLVELHGGEIWFDTREGQGTTFSFTLPLAGDWKPAEWLERTE